MLDIEDLLEKIEYQIIVSVQAQDNEPLNSPEHLLAISKSVISGGAGALRLCGINNIKHIKKEVKVPIIGLTKLEPTPINWLEKVYITPTMKDLNELLKTGIDLIAIDGTKRPRSDGATLEEQINLVKDEGKLVIADVSTLEDALNALKLGADLISTTLSGYTKETRFKVNGGPDFELLSQLGEETEVPIIMEGRIWDPEDVKEAFDLGAFAVVIGTAITRPQMITKRFVSAVPKD